MVTRGDIQWPPPGTFTRPWTPFGTNPRAALVLTTRPPRPWRSGSNVGRSSNFPPTVVVVTEHQLITRTCQCGARTTRVAPVGVQAPVPFGPRVTAVLAYLHHSQSSHVRPEPDARAPLHRLGTVPAAISGR